MTTESRWPNATGHSPAPWGARRQEDRRGNRQIYITAHDPATPDDPWLVAEPIFGAGRDRAQDPVEANSVLLGLGVVAPHTCEHADCPGVETAARLEIAEQLAVAAVAALDSNSRQHGAPCTCKACRLLREAISAYASIPDRTGLTPPKLPFPTSGPAQPHALPADEAAAGNPPGGGPTTSEGQR